MANFEILLAAERSYLAKLETLIAFAEDIHAWGLEHLARANDELKAAEKIDKEGYKHGIFALVAGPENEFSLYPGICVRRMNHVTIH
jgi:hypothetical protein